MSRHDPADPIIARIDRRDRNTTQRAREAAERKAAYDVVTAYLITRQGRDFRPSCEGAVDAVRDVYTLREDAPGASSLLASRAEQKIPMPDAKAQADKLFRAIAGERA